MGLRCERFGLETIHAMQACTKFAIARTRSPARETHTLPGVIESLTEATAADIRASK